MALIEGKLRTDTGIILRKEKPVGCFHTRVLNSERKNKNNTGPHPYCKDAAAGEEQDPPVLKANKPELASGTATNLLCHLADCWSLGFFIKRLN